MTDKEKQNAYYIGRTGLSKRGARLETLFMRGPPFNSVCRNFWRGI